MRLAILMLFLSGLSLQARTSLIKPASAPQDHAAHLRDDPTAFPMLIFTDHGAHPTVGRSALYIV